MDSAPWLEELFLSVERRYLDRLDFAVDQLRRLGWFCNYSKSQEDGSVKHITITLSRVVESDMGL